MGWIFLAQDWGSWTGACDCSNEAVCYINYEQFLD
jgi:hypothetical protein